MKQKAITRWGLSPGVTLATWLAAVGSGFAQEALDGAARGLAERAPAQAELAARSQAIVRTGEAQRVLPAPELLYQQWAVPLDRPYDLSRANMLMLGVRQRLPLRSLRDFDRARARAEVHEVEAMARDQLAQRTAQLFRIQLALAYSERALALHEEHARRLDQLEQALRSAYVVGRASQADLLELSATRAEIGLGVSEHRAARAEAERTWQILAAQSGADEGRVAPLPRAELERLPALTGLHVREAPQLAVAARRVEVAEVAVRRSQRAQSTPELMVGLDYMAMPSADAWRGYGAMVSISLPWLSSGASHEHASQRFTAESLRHAARVVEGELEVGLREREARYAGVRERLALLEREIMPAIERKATALSNDLASGRTELREVSAALLRELELRLMREDLLREGQLLIAELAELTGQARADLIERSQP